MSEKATEGTVGWDIDELEAASDAIAHTIDYALRELPVREQLAALTIAVAKVMATYGACPGSATEVIEHMAASMVQFAAENRIPLEELRARFQATTH